MLQSCIDIDCSHQCNLSKGNKLVRQDPESIRMSIDNKWVGFLKGCMWNIERQHLSRWYRCCWWRKCKRWDHTECRLCGQCREHNEDEVMNKTGTDWEQWDHNQNRKVYKLKLMSNYDSWKGNNYKLHINLSYLLSYKKERNIDCKWYNYYNRSKWDIETVKYIVSII